MRLITWKYGSSCIVLRACIFFPGTESSQSSDEGLMASYRRAITRAIQKTDSGVPSVPSQLITASHSAKNQAMTSTASSESELSSGEPQALKEEDITKFGDQWVVFHSPTGKVDKRPPRKVPKLSSRKLAQIKVYVHVQCMCIYIL